jgi:glycerol-3-phosphate dehydrogenase (NAD(P)+)
MIKTVSILGDGAWGTTLAIHLAKRKIKVVLWSAFEDHAKVLMRDRENKRFLPGYRFPTTLKVTHDIHEAIRASELIVLASPSEYLQATLQRIKGVSLKGKSFLSVVKGVHPTRLVRMSELIEEYIGKNPLAVLSGPTIAWEVAAGIPTTAVVASKSHQLAASIQELFNTNTFRIYTNTDVLGVEIGGSVKNVIAIACGICDGLGLGTNAKAAIVTRGLSEMTRLGVKLGAKRETFYGLTGLGDLVTTCFAPTSRNRSVGQALGKGQSIKSILSSMNQVAEGVVTAKAVYALAQKKNVPMPIVTQVYLIVVKGKSPKKAMADLMGRDLKVED